MTLKYTKHAIGQSTYHFVWKPKYNVKVFSHPYPRRIADAAIRDVASKWNIEIKELKVMSDHVHCFAAIPATLSVSQSLQYLKGGSARIIFRECYRWREFFARGHKKAHLWSPGKFFRSVGSVSEEVIENYIRNSQHEWKLDYKKRSL